MPRPAERPVRTEEGAYRDYTESHPAYGQIGASRVSSTPGHHLYGSDFRHGHYMTVTIRKSVMGRSLNGDWPHGRDEIIEVAMSEAQWATFVSATNMGLGVPCTIQYHNPEPGLGHMPSIIPVEDRREQFNREINERLRAAVAIAEAMRQGARTKVQREDAERLIRTLTDGLPWIAKRFDEHAEETVERAKIEVEAYLVSAVQRAGLTALGGLPAPIEIEGGDDVQP